MRRPSPGSHLASLALFQNLSGFVLRTDSGSERRTSSLILPTDALSRVAVWVGSVHRSPSTESSRSLTRSPASKPCA